MTGSSNDFEEFNKQTDDAWDGGDDDLLLEAFNVRISRRDVQSAATQVSAALSMSVLSVLCWIGCVLCRYAVNGLFDVHNITIADPGMGRLGGPPLTISRAWS